MLHQVVPQLACPILLFAYYNQIIKHGINNFMFNISQAGVRGLLIPDIPLEETEISRNMAAENNVELELMTTPATRNERMKNIVKASEGFVYLASTTGVTGARRCVNGEVERLLREIKVVTSKPVAVGLGFSKAKHVRQVAEWGADGVVVGSAIVKIMGEKAKSPLERLKELETFTKSLKSALD